MTKSIISELWKSVVGYEGFYEVSNHGNVRSVDRIIEKNGPFGYAPQPRKGKAVISHIDKDGYYRLGLSRDSGRRYFRVHTLVAAAFLGKRPDDCNQINHKDCDKTHNVPANLEWCDGKHNQRHSYQNGTHTLNLHRCPDTGRVIPKRMYAT
jgi:hypothetical protein